MSKSQLTKGLYAITPDDKDTNDLLTNVKHALLGGITLLQYRDKISDANQKLSRALAIHELCLQFNVPLIINDDPLLASNCQAEGVHLGQSDESIHVARDLLGEKAIIGSTCHHNVSLAMTAEKQGADYVAFGRFFNSSTKPGTPLATTKTLEEAKRRIHIPLVAIGGITLDNAKPLIDAGADYLAVVNGVFSQQDIASSCQNFDRLF